MVVTQSTVPYKWTSAVSKFSIHVAFAFILSFRFVVFSSEKHVETFTIKKEDKSQFFVANFLWNQIEKSRSNFQHDNTG